MKKTRLFWSYIAALSLAGACVVLPTPMTEAVSAISNPIPVSQNVSRAKYVIIASSASDYTSLRSDLQNAGAEILEEYSNIFNGAAVLVSLEQAQALQNDPRVNSIELDQFISSEESSLSNSDVIPGAYIIEMLPRASASAEESVLAFLDNNVTYQYTQAIRGFAARLTLSEVKLLRTNPSVKSVEPDRIIRVTGEQLSPTWGLDRLDQQNLPLNSRYSYQGSGSGVTAYIIDTGINSTLSEFGGRVRLGWPSTGASDCQGHGTHVAGTVGSNTYGVAKNVSLVSVRVLDCAGTGTTANIIAGLDWVVSDHAAGVKAVANMSLGGSFSSVENDAVNRVINDGVVMAVAAGNESVSACTKSPASTPAAITVAASDQSDYRASFSNYGSCVDVFAPGVSILSTLNSGGSGTKDGTSMASPHVAGAAAVIWSLNTSYTNSQVSSALINSATTNKIYDAMGSPNRLLYLAPSSGVAPGAPPSISATFASGVVSVSWTQPASSGTNAITSYQVVTSGGTPVCSWTSGPLQCQSSSLSGGTYTFKVSASSAGGTSPYSSLSNSVVVTTSGNNDFFSSARVLSGTSGTISDSNTSATREVGEPITSGSTSSTKWYSYVPSSSGYLTINTNGSSFDTVLGVFTGSSVSSLTTQISDDDSGDGSSSLASLSVSSGVSYFVQVGSYASGVTGAITLNWSLGSASCYGSPINDNLSCATLLSGTSGTIYSNNTNASLEYSEPGTTRICKSLWYKIIPSGSGTATFDAYGSSIDTVMTLYRSSSSNGTYSSLFYVNENDDYSYPTDRTSYLGSQSVTNGYTYFVRIAGYWNSLSYSCSYGSIALRWSMNITSPIVVPGTPTGATATRGTNSATVSWNAPSSNGGAIITSYTVTSSPGGYTCTTSSLSCTVTGLGNYVAYTFTVTARNSAGTSSPSVPSNSVVFGFENDNLSGALVISAGTVYSNNSQATSESGEPDHAGVSGGKSMWFRYSSSSLKEVSLNTIGSDFDTILAVYNSVTPATMSGLHLVQENDDDPNGLGGTSALSFVAQPNVVYYIAVDGYDAWGGPASGAITLNTVAQSLYAPSSPTRVLAVSVNGGASISWRKPDTNFSAITGYRVTSSPDGRTCDVGTDVYLCSISGLTNGTSYTFTVIAINPAGNSPSSTSSSSISPTSAEVTRSLATVWGIDRIDERTPVGDGFYSAAGRGQGTRIYIVDTGVRATHSEFTGRISSGFSTVIDQYGTSDCNGHGTHVASSAAGTTFGVATLATVVPVRVLDCDGSGSTSDVISGLNWVASNIQSTNSQAVVNMSLGGSFDAILNTAVRNIVNLGVPVVVAAGNDAQDACNSSPAGEPLAITVAASTDTNSEAGYSNYGSCVDVFAPGSGITAAGIATDTSTAVKSGTSMASPHVAGYAAVVKGLFPSASPSAVAAAITGSATPNALTNVSSGTVNNLLFTALSKCDVATAAGINCSSSVVTPTPSTTPTTTTTLPRTTVPSTSTTTVPAYVAPLPATPAPSLSPSPAAMKVSVLTSSNPATFMVLAMTANLSVPSGSKVTAVVPSSSAKYCKIKSGKVVAVKTGSCVIKVTVVNSSTKKTITKTVKIKVKK